VADRGGVPGHCRPPPGTTATDVLTHGSTALHTPVATQ